MTEPKWPEKCNVSLEPEFKRGYNEAIDACKKAYDEAKGHELVPLDEKEVLKTLKEVCHCESCLTCKESAIKICSTFATPKSRACEHEWAWFNRSGMYSCNKCHEWSYLGNHSNTQIATESTPKPRAEVSMTDIRMSLKGHCISMKQEEGIAKAIHKLLEEGK